MRTVQLAVFVSCLSFSACQCGGAAAEDGGAGGGNGGGETTTTGGGAATGGGVGGGTTTTGGGTATGGGTTTSDGGNGLDGSREAWCNGSGPALLVTDDGVQCTGDLAASVFRFALCDCGDYSSNGALTTSSFSGQSGMTLMRGASVGINGNFNNNRPVTIGGTLQVSGNNFTASEAITTTTDLLSNSGLSFSGHTVTVGRDARVGGSVQGGTLNVTGTLTVPASANVNTSGNPTVLRAPVSIAAPCECGTRSLVDVAGWVQRFERNNDNAAVDLDAGVGHNVSGDTTITLPCGRFFLSELTGTGHVRLDVSGRTALFVKGSINLGQLTVNLGTTGELDLFVEGSLTAAGNVQFGSNATPSRARTYLGGTTLNLQQAGTLAGNVYAPNATLTTGGSGLTVYGALFVGSLNPNGPLTINYDRDIVTAGGNCERADAGTTTPTDAGVIADAGTSCGACTDCRSFACVDGQCGACRTAADCCAPLTCFSGVCAPDIN